MAELKDSGINPDQTMNTDKTLVPDPSANISPLPDTLPDPKDVPTPGVDDGQPTVQEVTSTPLVQKIPDSGQESVSEFMQSLKGGIGGVIGDFFGKRVEKSDEDKALDDAKKVQEPPRPDEPTTVQTQTKGPATRSIGQDIEKQAILEGLRKRENLRLTPTDIKKFRPSFAGFQQQRKALDTIGDIDKRYYENLANIMDTKAGQELAGIDSQLTKELAARKSFLEENIDEFRKAFNEAKNEEFKYDYWGDRSTGQKIGMTIALALGGMAEGLTGRKNPVIDVIDKAMDRDLNIAKTKFQSKLAMKNKKLAYLQQMGKAMDASIAATTASKAVYLENIKRQIDKTANTMKGNKAKANAQLLKGQITAKQSQLQNQFNAQLAKAANEALKSQAARGLVSEQELFRNPSLAGKIPAYALPKPMRKLQVPGVGIASSLEDKKKITNLAAAKPNLIKNIKDIIAARTKYESDWNVLSPGYRNAKDMAMANITALQLILKNQDWYNLGVLTGPDKELLDSITGNPEDIFSFKIDALTGGPDPIVGKLQQIVDNIDDKWRNALQYRMQVFDPRVGVTTRELEEETSGKETDEFEPQKKGK